MVVFGSETLVRPSCEITGVLSAKAGLGGDLADLGTSDGGRECDQDGEYPDAMSREPQDRRKGHCKRSSYVRWDHLG